MLSSNHENFRRLPFKQIIRASFLRNLLLTQPERKLYDKYKSYQRMGIG